MIEMNNWATQAVAKLNEGRKEIPDFNGDDVTKKLRDSKLTQKLSSISSHCSVGMLQATKKCTPWRNSSSNSLWNA